MDEIWFWIVFGVFVVIMALMSWYASYRYDQDANPSRGVWSVLSPSKRPPAREASEARPNSSDEFGRPEPTRKSGEYRYDSVSTMPSAPSDPPETSGSDPPPAA